MPREHLHVAACCGQQTRLPWYIHVPRLALLLGAVPRILVPIDAVLAPAAGDHIRPAVLVHVIDVVTVGAHILLGEVVGAKRSWREVGPREPVSAVDDVRAPVAIEVADGAALIRADEELFFSEAQAPFVLALLHAAARENAQQENTCHKRSLHRLASFPYLIWQSHERLDPASCAQLHGFLSRAAGIRHKLAGL